MTYDLTVQLVAVAVMFVVIALMIWGMHRD